MTSSRFFSDITLSCPHCEWIPENGINCDLLELLDNLQREIDEPLEIVCCVRCLEYNELVNGYPNSYHTYGMACDISVPQTINIDDFADLCEDLGAKGIVVKYDEQVVHVDMREKSCREEK